MRGRSLVPISLGVVALVLIALSYGDLFPGSAGLRGLFTPPTAEADAGLGVTVSLSRPGNGAFLVPGERAGVAVTLKDKSGISLTRADFATLNLYAYGPQETTKTVTAVKLLNATADRSKTPHHYIDLLKDPNVRVDGNTLRYNLQPVSDEEAGTYTLTVWASKKDDPAAQVFALADFQLGTATVEKPIVEKENCAACHQGAANGQFYLHHVDPGRSPFGSPSIDSVPVRTCKSCHNNEGYAAFTSPADGSRVPDQIVRRVHGVHMGEHLKNPLNTDPATGIFKAYTEVLFPADVKNCTACHVDDRWKTKPSRLACGACHDNIWFGDAAAMPQTAKAHPGGPQANDASCATCHPADTGGVKAVAVAHKVPPPAFRQVVEVDMSPPANGKFYVAGEAPTVTIVVKDAITAQPIDPKSLVEPADAANAGSNELRRGNLFVSGPRRNTQPVLTAAAADVTKTYANNDFRVLKDRSKADPRFTRSDTSIVYQLDDVAGLSPGTYTVWVETMPGPAGALGDWELLNFQVGTETPEKKVGTNCTQCHGDTRMHAGFFAVEFNTDICKSCHDYKRQLQGKSGWTDSNNGFGAAPIARRVHGVHFGRYLDKPKEVHQQVDYSSVIFPQDVRNCTKCHSETSSWKEKPSRVACLACHDKDAAIGHAALQTLDLTQAQPYSGDEVETCLVCHGAGREWSADKVHNISDPYKPPYVREPER